MRLNVRVRWPQKSAKKPIPELQFTSHFAGGDEVIGKRTAVVGVTGSGKTTLAGQLAELNRIPHIELDRLHWLPGWRERSYEDFLEELDRLTRAENWVVDGNYSHARDLIWSRIDTLIWLDYPLWIILWRLLRRTLRRIIQQENLWDTGNRETWRKQFFSRDSLFLWAIRSYPRRRRVYTQLTSLPEYAHLRVIRLKSPRETDRWLRSVSASSP